MTVAWSRNFREIPKIQPFSIGFSPGSRCSGPVMGPDCRARIARNVELHFGLFLRIFRPHAVLTPDCTPSIEGRRAGPYPRSVVVAATPLIEGETQTNPGVRGNAF